MEDIREIPVVFMFTPISGLMKCQPVLLFWASVIDQGTGGRIGSHQGSERRPAVSIYQQINGFIEFTAVYGIHLDIKMDRAENTVVYLVTRKYILNIPGINHRPVVIIFPGF